MEDKKLTKKEKFEILKEIVGNSDSDNMDILVDFIDNEIAILDKKAEKSKERAAEKKTAGDELRARVKAALTKEYQTAEDIMNNMTIEDGEEITKAKITARLTQLINNGEAEKADAKIEGKNSKVKVYRLIAE